MQLNSDGRTIAAGGVFSDATWRRSLAPHMVSFLCFAVASLVVRAGASLIAGTPFASRGGAAPACAMSAYGDGLSQADLMDKDLLILVDGRDRVTGAMPKREAHTFSPETPRGWLHRAFSCFVFDEAGRMLLTKRADPVVRLVKLRLSSERLQHLDAHNLVPHGL